MFFKTANTPTARDKSILSANFPQAQLTLTVNNPQNSYFDPQLNASNHFAELIHLITDPDPDFDT